MKANCPHCGAPKHETKKRSYQCGSYESNSGVWYRPITCKMSETRKKDQEYWAQVAENADKARELAEIAKEKAEAEAKRDREFAQHWHERLEEEKQKMQAEFLQRIKQALGIEENNQPEAKE